MSLVLDEQIIYLRGYCELAEAESLAATLDQYPDARVDLFECDYLHTAVFQVLFCLRPPIVGSSPSSLMSAHLVALLKPFQEAVLA